MAGRGGIALVALIATLVAGRAGAQDLTPPLPLSPPLPADAGPGRDALACMTAAIAYEAGREPLSGQQAVGEVILNRMRDPIYPHTVCGVVFAGSERRTGCQFTFTCDGSLRRRLPAAIIAQSRAVAEAVLTQRIAPLVAGATHYHASYVSPYWAPSLIYLSRIGQHLFYRSPASRSAPNPPGALVAGGVAPPEVLALIDGVGAASVPVARVAAVPVQSKAAGVFSPWGL